MSVSAWHCSIPSKRTLCNASKIGLICKFEMEVKFNFYPKYKALHFLQYNFTECKRPQISGHLCCMEDDGPRRRIPGEVIFYYCAAT